MSKQWEGRNLLKDWIPTIKRQRHILTNDSMVEKKKSCTTNSIEEASNYRLDYDAAMLTSYISIDL